MRVVKDGELTFTVTGFDESLREKLEDALLETAARVLGGCLEAAMQVWDPNE